MKAFKCFILSMTLFLSYQISAQEGGKSAVSSEVLIQNSIRDFSIIGGATGLGALLGASTLSFVKEPSKHVKNILVGGAIGVIIGVGVVAYMQAGQSRQVFEGQAKQNFQRFNSQERTVWHHQKFSKHPSLLALNLKSWSF